MSFKPQDFRAALADGSNKLFQSFWMHLIYSLRYQQQYGLLARAMNEIASILRDSNQSPILKFKTVKFIIYLVLLGQEEVLECLAGEVYHVLKNSCHYNRSMPLATRGKDYFRHNKYNITASFEERTKIQKIGCRYILFCLQCIYVLAFWLPQDSKMQSISLFKSEYEVLLKQGVIFPSEDQFTFFSQERVKKIEDEINKWSNEIERISGKGKGLNDNKTISQKEQSLSNDLTVGELQINRSKRSIGRQLSEQQMDKIQQYELKIENLNEEVRSMKQILRKQSDIDEITTNKLLVKQLQIKIDRLTLENNSLKELSKWGNSINSSAKQETSGKNNSPSQKIQMKNMYLRQLLELGQQPQQFNLAKNKQRKLQFYDFKEAKDTFMPYYKALPRQLQIRLRRCLLKSKQILFKDHLLEIGIISEQADQIQVNMVIIITNLSQKPVCLLNNTFNYVTGDIQIFNGDSTTGKKRLKAGEQAKIHMKIVINNIDSKCITMLLQYEDQTIIQKLALLIPISIIKLVKTLPYSSHPSNKQHIERVIQYQKKILSKIQKLKDFYPKCLVEDHKNIKQYNIKLQLLQTIFFLSLNKVAEDCLRIEIKFDIEDRCLAQKLFSQFVFVFRK